MIPASLSSQLHSTLMLLAAFFGSVLCEAQADIQSSLDSRVTVEFVETPLGDVAMFLSDLTGLEIQIDANVDRSLPITCERKNTSLREVLDAIVQPHKIDWSVADQKIVLEKN